jgi:hypothetical protein
MTPARVAAGRVEQDRSPDNSRRRAPAQLPPLERYECHLPHDKRVLAEVRVTRAMLARLAEHFAARRQP